MYHFWQQIATKSEDDMRCFFKRFQDFCARLSGCKQCSLFYSTRCSLNIHHTPCWQWMTKAKKGWCGRKDDVWSFSRTDIYNTNQWEASWNRIWAVLLWMGEIHSNRKKTPTPTSPKSAHVSDVCYTFRECRDKKRWFTFFCCDEMLMDQGVAQVLLF